MNLLSLVSAVVGLARAIVAWLDKRQLLEAGEARAALAGLEETQGALRRAIQARRAVARDPLGLREDPYNRDRD